MRRSASHSPDLGVEGVVLSDHVKSLDWRARRAEPAGKVPDETVEEIIGKLSALLEGTEDAE